MDTKTPPVGLILCDDLMFASRVTATAAAHQLHVTRVRDVATLAVRMSIDRPSCLLVDLHSTGLNIEQAIIGWKALKPPPFVVAFGSHVDAATLSAARRAGCDVVLPRSAFADQLESELPRWLSSSS